MDRDIDRIIERMSTLRPDVRVSQLRVAHETDDDGLWFFKGATNEIQLESSSGACPFLVEAMWTDARYEAKSVDEAVAIVLSLIDRAK